MNDVSDMQVTTVKNNRTCKMQSDRNTETAAAS
jgi:hypothetical protein